MYRFSSLFSLQPRLYKNRVFYWSSADMISLTLSQRGRAYSKSPVSSHFAVRKYDLCRSSGANSGCPRDQYADFSDAFSAVNSNVNHAAPALGRGGKGNSTKPHWWRRLLSGFSHDGKQLVLMRSTAVTVLTSSAAADRPTDRHISIDETTSSKAACAHFVASPQTSYTEYAARHSPTQKNRWSFLIIRRMLIRAGRASCKAITDD